jgi:peptide/nickel transport system ATP-binding protein/oligopeptide transport system ATP-binding protein
MTGPTDLLLDVRDLRVRFRSTEGAVHAVQGVDVELRRGETLAVVGESGSGKSVSMLALLGLLPGAVADVTARRAVLAGTGDEIDLMDVRQVRDGHVRGRRIGYVAQDPSSSLNPTTTVGTQLAETVAHHLGLSRRDARRRAIELLERVGIPDPTTRVDSYPHELSGGMRQRVMIAIAISCSPELLIADEPTTALDVTVQAQIVDLVRDLRDELGLSVVWITHDLGVVADLADRVAVMYGGRIVETAPVIAAFDRPLHPYTIGLLDSVPRLGHRRERLASIIGLPPELHGDLTSCAFAPRCGHAFDRCRHELPEVVAPAADRTLACWFDVERGAPRHV